MAAGGTVLVDEPGRGLIVGVIDRSWRVDGGEGVPVRDAAEFAAFDRPGFVEALLAFRFVSSTPRGRAGPKALVELVTSIGPVSLSLGRRAGDRRRGRRERRPRAIAG